MQNAHNEKNQSVTGVLLAGGRSQRMGRDKALISLDGHPLYTRALKLLCDHFTTVIIAGDRVDLGTGEVRSIPDIFPGSALGGIHTGLSSSVNDWIFVAACDMPEPNPEILKKMLTMRDGVDAVIPVTPAGYEPVFALYHKACLPYMEEMLTNEQHRIYKLYEKINVRYLDWKEMPKGWQKNMTNINTPDQLEQARKGSS